MNYKLKVMSSPQRIGEGLLYKDTDFCRNHQRNHKDILSICGQIRTNKDIYGHLRTNTDIALGGGCIFALLTTDYTD